MRFTDYTRTSLDDTCPKARYWGFEYQGRGLSPVEPNEALAFGLAIARGAMLVRQGWRTWAAGEQSTDQDILQAGLLEAYRTIVWPRWMREFELLHTEVEVGIQLTPDLFYMARPDAVIRRKADQTVWILSDKTTSLSADTFVRLWDKSVQNHAECVAVERTLGLTVSGFYTQGWVKGYTKDRTIYSPLCYGWVKEGQLGLTKDQWREKYVYGWERRRIDRYTPLLGWEDGGIVGWVTQLPVEVVNAQFPVAGPIPVRRDLVDTYLQQIALREGELMTPLAAFPQRFHQCDEFGKFRRPCTFRDCCWSPVVGRDPLGSGLYQVREPHHDPEKRQVMPDVA